MPDRSGARSSGSPFGQNWFLVAAVVGAHGLHLLAGLTPGLSGVLEIQPIALSDWALVGALAVSLILVMELYKILYPWPETEA